MEKVITTHLMDGVSQGLRDVFISNQICHMYVIPRDRLSEANNNSDITIGRPAFYILLGAPEDLLQLPMAYIGHSENFKERVAKHKLEKDFWDTALVFVAGDNSLTKIDMAYIESLEIAKARNVKNYILPNIVQPKEPSLPPHLRASDNQFIEDIELLTSFIGCKIFSQATHKANAHTEVFHLKSRGAHGKAIYSNGKLTVLAESIIASTSTPSLKKGALKRDEMVQNLTEDKGGKRILKVNIELSPSGAATFVSGLSQNGWDYWKNDKGEPLSKYRP